MLERLLDGFYQIRTARVCSCALWIIGEYCTSAPDIVSAFEVGLAVLSWTWRRELQTLCIYL